MASRRLVRRREELWGCSRTMAPSSRTMAASSRTSMVVVMILGWPLRRHQRPSNRHQQRRRCSRSPSMSTRSLRNLAIRPSRLHSSKSPPLSYLAVEARPSLRQSYLEASLPSLSPAMGRLRSVSLTRSLHHRQSHTRAHSSLRHSPRRSRHQTRTAASSVRLSPRRNRRLNRRLNRRQPCRLSLPPSPLHH